MEKKFPTIHQTDVPEEGVSMTEVGMVGLLIGHAYGGRDTFVLEQKLKQFYSKEENHLTLIQ